MHDVLTGKSARKVVFSQYSSPQEWVLDPSQQQYLQQEENLLRAHFSSYMAVSKEAKYIYSAPDNREFFFDRISDPLERRNRAGVMFVQQAKQEMKQTLIRHLKAGGETAGIVENEWKQFPKVSINPDPDAGLLIQDLYTPWANMELPDEYQD